MSSAGNIKNFAATILGKLVEKVTVDKLIDGTKTLGSLCAGGAIPFDANLAGTIAAMSIFGILGFRKAAKDRAKDEDQAKHCERVGQLLEQLKHGQSAARDQLADIALQQQWFKDAIAKGPDAFNAAWKHETAACAVALKTQLTELKADTTQIQSTLDELAHLEFDTNWRVREIALVLADHGKKLDSNTDLLNQILSHVKHHPSREEIEREIRPRLEQEIEAKLRREQTSPGVEDLQAQAKRLADIAITALNTKGFAERAAEVGGAVAVLEGLQKQAAAHETAARHHIDASIGIWRKTAEWAYLVGEIETAAESLRRIVAVRPNDFESLRRLGWIQHDHGQIEDALKTYSLAKDAATNDLQRARVLGNIALVLETRGKLSEAIELHQDALELHTELFEEAGMARDYGNLGVIEQTRGNLNAAEEYHQKSLAIEEKLGHQEGIAIQYGNLGAIERTRGNLDAAEEYLKKSLAIDEKLGRQEGMAATYGNLGVIERSRGNLDAADEYLKKSLSINEKLGLQEGMAIQYGNLGVIEQTRGNLDAAEEYLKKSLAI
ncbi:MAG: tetratricopeptide repeat protein, partial [Phycisphaerales bacterium]|nr:tetratricopeptide repeat protein [Phycisphaerales bacterium]